MMAPMADVATVTSALFGDLVDVSKMDPGPSDVHSFGESNRAVLIPKRTGRRRGPVRKDTSVKHKVLEGVGIGATGIGAALGARELKGSIPEARGLWRAKEGWLTQAKPGKKLQRIPRPGPAARTAGVVGMLGGDAIATGEQVSNAKSKQPVTKAVPVGDMVRGILGNSRKMNDAYIGRHAAGVARHAGERKPLLGYAPKHAGPRAAKASTDVAPVADAPKPDGGQAPGEKGMALGQRARKDFGNFAGTATGKVVLGATGAAGVGHLVARRTSQPQPYDPYVSKKLDWEVSGTFSKFDDDRRLAFGWANVSKINGQPVVDRQGDYVSIEDIEDAAYTYVEQSRVGGDMHKRIGGKADGTGDRPHHVADMVESMVFDDAKCETLGLPDDFPRGWWVGFRVFDDDVWEMAKDGRRAGFSIHGKGIRKSVDYDELMGAR